MFEFRSLHIKIHSFRLLKPFTVAPKAALNVVQAPRAGQGSLLPCPGARRCGIKPKRSGARRSQLRLTNCSGTFSLLMNQVNAKYRVITGN